MLHIVSAETPFDAQHAIVGCSIKRGIHAINVVVFDFEIHLAAHATVGTSGADSVVRI
jgi:hypothetical protein